jgi:tetraacyldisaccharide 4'-kinase
VTRGRIEDRLARAGGLRELLRVPAGLYAAAVGLRGALYDRGLLPVEHLDAPVISVGNLSVGGTGKTPMVALIVRELIARGIHSGVLSRGYRSDHGGANDEARLLAELLPDVPHVQDKQRARGGRRLIDEHAVDAIVVDDGFQHRGLARDLDIVLIDATRPWGLPSTDRGEVRALLPRGLLRESPFAAARAHALVVTRADQVAAPVLERLVSELNRITPGVPVLTAAHRPVGLRDFFGERRELRRVSGIDVDLVSGIGNPDAFRATLEQLGARIREERRFPDHHAFDADDVRGLAGPIVCTSKDAVKLRPLGIEILALEVELTLLSGAPVLEALLDALPPSRAARERAALHEGLHG